jgi:hypothetical protein
MPFLKQVAGMAVEDFANIDGIQTVETKDKRPLYLLDQGSSLLGIAHLDSVQKHEPILAVLNHPLETRIYCPVLDDRIGVWTMLHVLPALGIKLDVLLSDGEESGNPTSRDFVPSKKYLWMTMFDRTGLDCVMYRYYQQAELKKALEEVKFNTGHGSFSDISSMHIGCSGFNVGVGYYDYHGPMAYFKLSEYITNIVKFVEFHKKYQHTHFVEPVETIRTYSNFEHFRKGYKYPETSIFGADRLWIYAGKCEWELVADKCAKCGTELDDWNQCSKCDVGYYHMG